MRNSLKIIIALIIIYCSNQIKAQIPINDPAWILQPDDTLGGTEEFNAPLDYTDKWHDQYPWGTGYSNGAELVYPANLIQTGTTLKIKADTLDPNVTGVANTNANLTTTGSVTIAYQSGVLWSRELGNPAEDVYHFGYLEISAKYPSDSVYPLWPAFWLWSAGCVSGVPYYDEIDICENGAGPSFEGDIMGTNYHLYSSGTCASTINTDDGVEIQVNTTISDAFHKYAVQWLPDRFIYYFDDVPVRTIYDPTGANIPQHPMAVILNLAIDPYWAFLPADWDGPAFPNGHINSLPTNFPINFEIDYLRYYKLNTDCTTDLTICGPGTDYSSRAVEKSITTGGSCSPSFNPSTTSASYTLRATDYVLLDEGTTIDPIGTGYFAIEIVQCPQ